MAQIRAIDSHCHADIANRKVSNFFTEYKSRGISGISWSYVEGIKSYHDYPQYWNNLQKLCTQFQNDGLPFFYLVGIHPRCIPEDMKNATELPAELVNSLEVHIKHPLCLGIGEIGLDIGTNEEERIFRLQLEFAESRVIPTKRVGIHTPRNNKLQMTKKILNIMDYYEPLHAFTVIDHVLPETFEMVLDNGYMMGITLQKGKALIDDLLWLVEKYPDKMSIVMLNSDCAREISEPYIQFIDEIELGSKGLKEALVFSNCCSFFQLNKGGFKL